MAAAGRGRHLPEQGGDRGGGGRGRCILQAFEVAPKKLPVSFGAVDENPLLELFEKGRKRPGREEMELAHERDLLHGVKEVVGDRDLGPSAVLRRGPVMDVLGHQVGRVPQEHLERIRDHQGRQSVRKVLPQLLEGLAQLRIDRLAGHFDWPFANPRWSRKRDARCESSSPPAAC